MRGYTFRQLRAFTEAAGRARRRQRVEQLVDMRAAQAVDEKKLEAYLRKLTDG